MIRRLVSTAALLLAFGVAAEARAPRAVLLSLDGNALWFFRRVMLDPVSADVAWHRFAPGVPLISNFAAVTPAGHGAMFSGTYADVNGVTGFNVFRLPHEKNNLLSTFSGFDGNALLVKPVWILTALHGVKTTVFQATQEFPMQVTGDERARVDRSLVLVDGFARTFGGDALIPFSQWVTAGDGRWTVTIGSTTFMLTALPDGNIGVVRKDDPTTRQHPTTRQQMMGKGVERRVNLVVTTSDGTAGAYLAWIRGAAATKDAVLYVSEIGRRTSNRDSLLGPLLVDPPPMIDAAVNVYTSGGFGPTIADGGSGEAEETYIATAIASIDNAEKFAVALQKSWGRSDVEIYYLPFPDEMLHLWAGYVMPESPVYDAAHAEQYWQLYARVMNRIARFIETAIFGGGKSVPENVFVGADHGMDYSTRYFYANEVLRRQGLLAWKDKYTVDLAKTQILLPAGGGSFLSVNLKRYLGGIVPEEEKEEVMHRASRALLSTRDPDTRQPIVRNAWPAALWRDLGTGGPRGGDIYLQPERGYTLSNWSTTGYITAPRGANNTGDHGGWPLPEKMWAMLLIATRGESFATGPCVELPQLMPTILNIVGVPTPRYVTAPPLERGAVARSDLICRDAVTTAATASSPASASSANVR